MKRAIRTRIVMAAGLGLVVALAGWWAIRPPAGSERVARPGQPAPEITGGPWLGSEPLSLAGLRGRVVLVEFWTYG